MDWSMCVWNGAQCRSCHKSDRADSIRCSCSFTVERRRHVKIENIVDKEPKESDCSKEEIASSKGELTQAVTISLCSFSSQTWCNPLPGCLRSCGIASMSLRHCIKWLECILVQPVTRQICVRSEHCRSPPTESCQQRVDIAAPGRLGDRMSWHKGCS